jgi:hypothetical protein
MKRVVVLTLVLVGCVPMTKEQRAVLWARDEMSCRWRDLHVEPWGRDDASWLVEGCGQRLLVTCMEVEHKPKPGHDVPFIPNRKTIECVDECLYARHLPHPPAECQLSGVDDAGGQK